MGDGGGGHWLVLMKWRPSNTVAWAEAYLHTKWHLDASSRLATIEMAENWGGGLRPLLEKGTGSPYNTKSPGLRPTYNMLVLGVSSLCMIY